MKLFLSRFAHLISAPIVQPTIYNVVDKLNLKFAKHRRCQWAYAGQSKAQYLALLHTIHPYIVGHHNPLGRITTCPFIPPMLCVWILYMSSGAYCLSRLWTIDLWVTFSWPFFYLLSEVLPEISWEKKPRNK